MLEIDKIYQVDCLDGMSKIDDKSVSLILTDPPYEISRDSNYAKSAISGILIGNIINDYEKRR